MYLQKAITSKPVFKRFFTHMNHFEIDASNISAPQFLTVDSVHDEDGEENVDVV